MSAPGWRWVVAHLALWVATVVGSLVGTLSVRNDPYVLPGPMEQLGTLATALAVGSIGVGLREPVPWLAEVASEPHWRRRGRRLVICTSVLVIGVAGTTPLMPEFVSPSIRLELVVVDLALAACGLLLGGAGLAGGCPVVVTLVCSVGGIVPWSANVYNPEVLAWCWAPALVVVLIALCSWVAGGQRVGGQA